MISYMNVSHENIKLSDPKRRRCITAKGVETASSCDGRARLGTVGTVQPAATSHGEGIALLVSTVANGHGHGWAHEDRVTLLQQRALLK